MYQLLLFSWCGEGLLVLSLLPKVHLDTACTPKPLSYEWLICRCTLVCIILCWQLCLMFPLKWSYLSEKAWSFFSLPEESFCSLVFIGWSFKHLYLYLLACIMTQHYLLLSREDTFPAVGSIFSIGVNLFAPMCVCMFLHDVKLPSGFQLCMWFAIKSVNTITL